jgi:hypothetical protein
VKSSHGSCLLSFRTQCESLHFNIPKLGNFGNLFGSDFFHVTILWLEWQVVAYESDQSLEALRKTTFSYSPYVSHKRHTTNPKQHVIHSHIWIALEVKYLKMIWCLFHLVEWMWIRWIWKAILDTWYDMRNYINLCSNKCEKFTIPFFLQ